MVSGVLALLIAFLTVSLESMKAANRERDSQGYSDAYGEKAFADLGTRFQIHHNDVLTVFNQANRGLT